MRLLPWILLALVACNKTPQQIPPTTATAPKTEAASVEPVKVEPAEPPDPNDAYLVAGDNRHLELHRIHDGKVTQISLGLRQYDLKKAVQTFDGTLLVASEDKLLSVAGQQVTVSALPARSPTLVIGRDGSVWALGASFGGKPGHLWHRQGARWQELALPPEASAINIQLAVDKKGRPWVSTVDSVYHYDTTWTKLGLPPLRGKTRSMYAPDLVATDEMVMVNHGERYTEIGDTGLGKRSYYNYEHPEPRIGGGWVTGDPELRISVYGPDGKMQKRHSLKGKIFGKSTDNTEYTRVVDGQGRLWLANDSGLVIIEPDGSIQQWEPGRVPGLERFTAQRILVSGQGPKLPTLGPKIRFEVAGRIAVTAPTAVEMCDGGVGFSQGFGGGSFYGATPCVHHTMRWTTRTDAEGHFKLTGVPPYPMSVVFRENGKSWAVRHPKCCSEFRSAEPLVHDVGQL